MVKGENPQLVTFCNAHTKLEEVVLDNDRGMIAAELYTALLPKAQAFQLRQKALLKERQKLVDDHAKKDAKGNRVYRNPTEPDPDKKLIQWKDEAKAEAAFKAWTEKAEALDTAVVTVDAAPLPDDFFSKPTKLTVEQSVRTAFLPFLAKHQAQAMVAAPKSAKRRKR